MKLLSTMIGYSIRIHEVKKVLTFIMGTNNPMLIKEKVIINFITRIFHFNTYFSHFSLFHIPHLF